MKSFTFEEIETLRDDRLSRVVIFHHDSELIRRRVETNERGREIVDNKKTCENIFSF